MWFILIILSNYFCVKVSYVVQKYTEIIVGRMQALEEIINEREITLINLYGPNNDDQTFFDQLETFINDHNEKNFIVGGISIL